MPRLISSVQMSIHTLPSRNAFTTSSRCCCVKSEWMTPTLTLSAFSSPYNCCARSYRGCDDIIFFFLERNSEQTPAIHRSIPCSRQTPMLAVAIPVDAIVHAAPTIYPVPSRQTEVADQWDRSPNYVGQSLLSVIRQDFFDATLPLHLSTLHWTVRIVCWRLCMPRKFYWIDRENCWHSVRIVCRLRPVSTILHCKRARTFG